MTNRAQIGREPVGENPISRKRVNWVFLIYRVLEEDKNPISVIKFGRGFLSGLFNYGTAGVKYGVPS